MRLLAPSMLILLTLAPSVFSETIDVDALPRKSYKLPNGDSFEIVTFRDIPYRVVAPDVLSDAHIKDAEICLEAKFAALAAPDKVKITGSAALIVLENIELLKNARDFKSGDNIWFCGTLRPASDGKSVQLFALAAVKLDSDTQRFANELARIETKLSELTKSSQSPQRLELSELALNLGRKIDSAIKDVQLQAGLEGGEKLKTIAANAYQLGLKHKEAALRVLKPDDAEAYFELSEQWREYLRNDQHCRELLLKCLQLDPEHPRATQMAQERFKGQLERYAGGWMTADDAARRKTTDLKNAAQSNEALRLKEESFQRSVALETSQRRERILSAQRSLRTTDPEKLAGAIESLSDAINVSLDSGFGVQAINLLSDIDAPDIVSKGLNAATHSRWPDVRRAAYEALAWRSLATDEEATALKVLSDALKIETDPYSTRVAVEALTAAGSKPGLATLIDSLATPDAAVRDEIVAGLKKSTHQSFTSKEEWENWWKSNK